MSHNFGFVTGYEIRDGNGKIIAKNRRSEADRIKEGSVKTRIYGIDGRLENSIEQPMRSFVAGMVEDFVEGYRISLANTSYSANAPRIILGSKNSPVYVQQILPIAPYINISQSALLSGSVNSETVPMSLIAITDQADSTRVTLHTARKITGGNGYLKEIAFYSDSGRMLARDVISPEAGFGVGKTVETAWTCHFPATASKALTKNWIKNWIQNIAVSAYTDFKTLSGVSATGTMAYTSASFTKEANTRGGYGADDIGIIIGTSDSDVSADNYALGAQIAHGSSGGQMEYAAMPTTSSIAVIHPTQGKAEVTYCRDFTNNSGSPITVKEAGIVAKTAVTTEGVETAGSYLLARWLTNDITVQPGETLRVYFQPTVTATAENHENISSDVILVTDVMRETYPELADISMIQKAAQSGKSWDAAMNYARGLTLGGYSDWRLPRCVGNNSNRTTANELYGIYRAKSALGISDTNSYWSATEKDASHAWNVNFSNGNVYNYSKNSAYYVLCVR